MRPGPKGGPGRTSSTKGKKVMVVTWSYPNCGCTNKATRFKNYWLGRVEKRREEKEKDKQITNIVSRILTKHKASRRK